MPLDDPSFDEPSADGPPAGRTRRNGRPMVPPIRRRPSRNPRIDLDLTEAEDLAGMAHALDMARRALAVGELPIGAAVVADGVVIARSHTQEVTQRRMLVHAELLALEDADREPDWDRRAATLYTTLEPCVMCLGAAAAALVGRVVFALPSDGDGACRLAPRLGEGRSPELPHLRAPRVVGDVGAHDAAALFRAYVGERSDSLDPFVRWAEAIVDRHAEESSVRA